MSTLSDSTLSGSTPVGSAVPAWLNRAMTRLTAAVQASGEARARGELLAYADACQSMQPQLAAELRAASSRIVTR